MSRLKIPLRSDDRCLGEESRSVSRKSPSAPSIEKPERIACPGQSYEITQEMCEARRANNFPRCARCRRAAKLARSA